MFGDERILKVAGEWVLKAENDLKTAMQTLKLGAKTPTDTVCFHAQQCIEKYLKALLVFRGIDFPKTHDLSVLIALLSARYRPGLTVEEQRQLTGYATTARYPGDYEPIALDEARQAVSLARRTRKELKKFLPARTAKT